MDTNTPTLSSAEPILSWNAPIHPVHDRSPKWYLYGSIFVVACAVYGIFTSSWTFSLVILLVGGMYFLTRHAENVIRQITINKNGFELGGVFTSWGDCKDFWIVQTSSYTELHIARRRGLDREAMIQTANIDTTQIRSCLSQFIPERSDQKERLVDMFIRLCKL